MANVMLAGKPYVVPGRPEILIQVTTLLSQPEVDFDQVVAVLRKDVALYTSVLATANSPIFPGSGKVSSLSQAVMRLGLKKLLTILRIIALKNTLSKAGRLERFWDTATEVSEIMVGLIQEVSTLNTEDAYSLGMMHNCGIPLMMEAIPDYREFLKNADTQCLLTLLKQEKKQYGIHHFKISSEIAKGWHTPSNVATAIKLQAYDIKKVLKEPKINEAAKMLLCTLNMAKDISETYRHYWRIESQQQTNNELKPVLAFVGLPEMDYLDLREEYLIRMDQIH